MTAGSGGQVTDRRTGADRTRVLVTGATGYLGRQILAAMMAHPDVEPIAACRTPSRLPAGFTGEVRGGDLLDPGYRQAVVDGVDVVCHAGTGRFLGSRAVGAHQVLRARHRPDRAVHQGRCGAFPPGQHSRDRGTVTGAAIPVDDRSPTAYTGFWPHLDRLVDLDNYLRANRDRGTQLVTMRLGHFVGAGTPFGLVPMLAARLRTQLVPWLAGGRARLPLVADTDLGQAFALAATADGLAGYESFNISGPDFPTAREVIGFIAAETGAPPPRYSVPYPAGHAFGWLMEAMHPVLPGVAPFLTRSIVHVSRDWWCPSDLAHHTLGYTPRKSWQTAVRESLAQLAAEGYPSPRLSQEV